MANKVIVEIQLYMYEMDLVNWIDIKLQYILCTFWVIIWFEMKKLFIK
jgi:hypothetical protein